MVFRLGRRYMNLPSPFETGFPGGTKGWGIVGLCGFVGLIGLLLGQAVGSSIRIKENSTSLRLNILWHCVANGCMVWIADAGILCGLAIGDRTRLAEFSKQYGESYFWSVLAVAVAGSMAMAALLGEISTRRHGHNDAGEKVMLALPLLVGLPMGLVQAHLWNLPQVGGAIHGSRLPFLDH